MSVEVSVEVTNPNPKLETESFRLNVATENISLFTWTFVHLMSTHPLTPQPTHTCTSLLGSRDDAHTLTLHPDLVDCDHFLRHGIDSGPKPHRSLHFTVPHLMWLLARGVRRRASPYH